MATDAQISIKLLSLKCKLLSSNLSLLYVCLSPSWKIIGLHYQVVLFKRNYSEIKKYCNLLFVTVLVVAVRT